MQKKRWLNITGSQREFAQPSIHLEELVLLASPLFPFVDNAAPEDPGVLLQVGQIRGGRGARHQRRAAVAPRARHGAHGLGIGLQ